MRLRPVLASLLVLCACSRSRTPSTPAAEPRPDFAIVDHSRPALPIADTAVEAMPAAVEATYRVTPDRRFLRAAADIDEILSGRHNRSVDIDHVGDRWKIAVAGKPAGELSDTPTFAEGLAMLTAFASTFPANEVALSPDTARKVDDGIAAFYTPDLLAAAKTIGNASDAAAFAHGARIATLIGAQTFDRFAIADPLLARALALIAIAESRGRTRLADEEAVTARVFGYSTEAEQLMQSTAADSLARAFITGSVPDSRANEPAFRYLKTLNAFDTTPVSGDESRKPFAGTVDMRAPQILLEGATSRDEVPLSMFITRSIAVSLDQPAGTVTLTGSGEWMDDVHVAERDLAPASTLSRFETALNKHAPQLASKFLDEAAVRSAYESNYYAAVCKGYDYGYFFLASAKAARDYIDGFGNPASLTGRDVKKWMELTTAGWYGGGRGAQAKSIAQLQSIGARSRFDALDALINALGWMNQPVRGAINNLYAQLDSRPAELKCAGIMSSRYLLDPVTRDRYFPLVIERAPSVMSDSLMWYYAQTDPERLLAVAASRERTADERGDALRTLLQFRGSSDDSIDTIYRSIVNESSDAEVVLDFGYALRDEHKFAEQERITRAWLRKNGATADAIVVSNVAALLGNALEQQGRYKEAFAVVEPHIEVYNQAILWEATSLLQRLGRDEEAMQLGQSMIERYAGVRARVDYAEVLWRMKRFTDAAALFDPKKYRMAKDEWERYPRIFARDFAANRTDALAAFDALVATGLGPEFLSSVPKAMIEKNAALALELNQRLLREPQFQPKEGSYWPFVLQIGYDAVKTAKGKDAADQWLDAQVPTRLMYLVLFSLYDAGEYEPAAHLGMRRPLDPVKTTEIVTLTAAALTQLQVAKSDPRWQQLRAEVASQNDKDLFVVITKYLAGIYDEPTFVGKMNSHDSHWSAAYFIGVNAAIAGDAPRARDMLLAAENGVENYPPQVWATKYLVHWTAARQPWTEIAKHPAGPWR